VSDEDTFVRLIGVDSTHCLTQNAEDLDYHEVAGWSSRGVKWAGVRDVGEERSQRGRWGGGRWKCQ